MKKDFNDKVVIASPVRDLLNAMILQFLREICPTVQIEQFLLVPDQAEKRLLAGELDLVVTPITMQNAEISHVKCAEEEIVLVVGQDHPLAGKGAVRLWDARNDSFLVNESSFDKRILTVHCELVGFTPNITLYSNENSVIHRALHYNMGVSLIPGNVLYRNRDTMEGLVPLRLTDVEIIRMIGVATRKDRILSNNAQKLVNFACRYFERLGAETSDYLDSILPPVELEGRKTMGIRNIRSAAAPARPFSVQASSQPEEE
ncbi:MAG: LysR family transcriptional regulator substrate-binding protein [Oscillospiraceae bacterium]|nr:LysR family transcriptional regulator substrate-binding protein [Oscillospiraceae bacterium]